MGILSIFGGKKRSSELTALLESGAVIIDVRSPEEYKTGHVKGSLNIPLGKINRKMSKIKQLGKPVITCCASGMRSSSAAAQLNGQGITAMNGGVWTKVRALKG